MEYSQTILNYMESNGVTGYKISKSTGISVSLFSKWKVKPTSKIDATTLTKIAEYFKITTDALLGKETKKISPPSLDDELTTEEKQLLQLFRHASEQNKNKMLGVLDILSSQEKEEKNKI